MGTWLEREIDGISSAVDESARLVEELARQQGDDSRAIASLQAELKGMAYKSSVKEVRDILLPPDSTKHLTVRLHNLESWKAEKDKAAERYGDRRWSILGPLIISAITVVIMGAYTVWQHSITQELQNQMRRSVSTKVIDKPR